MFCGGVGKRIQLHCVEAYAIRFCGCSVGGLTYVPCGIVLIISVIVGIGSATPVGRWGSCGGSWRELWRTRAHACLQLMMHARDKGL